MKNLVQQLTEELTEQTQRSQQLLNLMIGYRNAMIAAYEYADCIDGDLESQVAQLDEQAQCLGVVIATPFKKGD